MIGLWPTFLKVKSSNHHHHPYKLKWNEYKFWLYIINTTFYLHHYCSHSEKFVKMQNVRNWKNSFFLCGIKSKTYINTYRGMIIFFYPTFCGISLNLCLGSQCSYHNLLPLYLQEGSKHNFSFKTHISLNKSQGRFAMVATAEAEIQWYYFLRGNALENSPNVLFT